MEWNGKGMEWNGNFCMEYGRCLNGMEDFNGRRMKILPMIKMMTQSPLFYSVSVSFSIFRVQQCTRTTAISNNINTDDQNKDPGPPLFKFLPAKLNIRAGRNSVGLL